MRSVCFASGVRRGVTFTEIMICTVIVSILSISIFISYSGSTEDATIAHNLQKLAKLQEQVEQVYAAALQASYSEVQVDDWEFAELPFEKDSVYGPSPALEPGVKYDLVSLSLNVPREARVFGLIQGIKGAEIFAQEKFCVVRTRLGVKAAMIAANDPFYANSPNHLNVLYDIRNLMGISGPFSGDVISPSHPAMGQFLVIYTADPIAGNVETGQIYHQGLCACGTFNCPQGGSDTIHVWVGY